MMSKYLLYSVIAICLAFSIFLYSQRQTEAALLTVVPIAIFLGALVLENPHYLGIGISIALYINIDSWASYWTNSDLSNLRIGLSLSYLFLLILSKQLNPPINKAFSSYIGYFAIIGIMAPFVGDSETSELLRWFLQTLYVLNAYIITYIALCDKKRFVIFSNILIAMGVLLAFINFMEFIGVSFFRLSDTPGRSAGLHRNPNLSGSAILDCLLVSFLYTSPWANVVRVFMLVGIYTTFSRAAFLKVLLLLSYYIFSQRKQFNKRTVGTLLLFATIIFMAIQGDLLVSLSNDRNVTKMLTRITDASVGNFGDRSAQFRKDAIFMSIRSFFDSPIIGNGINSSRESGYLPHNQLLFVLVEHGLFGMCFYLAYLWQNYRALRNLPKNSFSFLVFMLYISQLIEMFFSHNLYHMRCYIIVTAMISAGTIAGRDVSNTKTSTTPNKEPADINNSLKIIPRSRRLI